MPTPADGYAGDVTPQEAWQLVRDAGARLVDVRTRAELSFVGVPNLDELGQETLWIEWLTYPDGQINQAFGTQLRQRLAGHDPAMPVVFLCRSGVRSAAAARVATRLGYTSAYNVQDGFEGPVNGTGHRGSVGWRAVGLPWRQG